MHGVAHSKLSILVCQQGLSECLSWSKQLPLCSLHAGLSVLTCMMHDRIAALPAAAAAWLFIYDCVVHVTHSARQQATWWVEGIEHGKMWAAQECKQLCLYCAGMAAIGCD